MNTTMRKILPLALVIGLPLLALAEVATSSADFMKLPVGGRFSAMNGNVLATAVDIEALNASIGGLSRLEKMQIFLQHEQWYLGIGHEVIGIGTPLKIIFPGKLLPGVAAFSVEWLHTGSFPAVDSWGNELATVGLNCFVVRLGYGLQFVKSDVFDLGAGINFGFVNQSAVLSKQIFNAKPDSKPTVDIGVHAKITHHQPSLDKVLGESFNVALLWQNVDFNKGTSGLPMHLQFGLGGQLFKAVNFDLDCSWYKGAALVPGIGLEYWIQNMIAIRTGFKYDVNNPAMLSAGLGFKKQIGDYWIYFDYGTQLLGAIESFPPMNFSLKFDISKIEIKDKTDIYYYKGVDYFVHNNYKEAIAMWNKVLAKNPDHAEAKKRIAEAQRLMKLEEEQKKMKNLESDFQDLQEMQKLQEPAVGTNAAPAPKKRK